jgi:hypothetical protein
LKSPAATEAVPMRTNPVNSTTTPRVQDDVPERIRPLTAAAETREPFAETRVRFRRA